MDVKGKECLDFLSVCINEKLPVGVETEKHYQIPRNYLL